MDTNDVGAARGRPWTVPASAIAFAVLLVAGVLVAGAGSDTADKSAEEVVKLFRDNKSAEIVAGYLLVLAGLAFLPLAWTMIKRVSAGLSEMGEQLARWSVVLFVAMLLSSGILFASLSAAVSLGGEDDPPADLIRFVPQIGFGMLLLAGALSASLFLVLVSRARQRSGAVLKWFWILGYVAAVAMLVAVMFIPMVLLPIWAIAAAVVLRTQAP